MPQEQQCPICGRAVSAQARYPSYVCRNCLEEAPPVNRDGKRISYTNVDASGGIQSQIEGSADWLQGPDCEPICYVKGRRCRAEEARSGGVVIQVSYKLLGKDGPCESPTRGKLGGNGQARIYGRLDCWSAVNAVKAGVTYQKHRVFFKDEETAVASGYRPCGHCMRAEYKAWKAAKAVAGS